MGRRPTRLSASPVPASGSVRIHHPVSTYLTRSCLRAWWLALVVRGRGQDLYRYANGDIRRDGQNLRPLSAGRRTPCNDSAA